MTMTIVMEDAVANLRSGNQQFIKNHRLKALLYADDTLLLGACPASVERFLAAVEVSGAAFSMQLHADKFQLLQVGSASPVRNTAGDIIEQKTHMLYLGASITDDGRIQSELSRRIGAANADLRALARVWRQSSLSRCRKLQIFNATICSKLTYGLAAACLNVAERRR